MVRAMGTAPPCSCPRSRRLTFRLRSGELPSALNPAPGHYFDRARSLPAHQVQLGKMKWSSIRVLRPVFRFGRPACISQHLCSGEWPASRSSGLHGNICPPSHKATEGNLGSTGFSEGWSPVLELHQPRGFAGRCLGCSANGTCEMQRAEDLRASARMFPTRPGFNAAVFVAVTGWPLLAIPSCY